MEKLILLTWATSFLVVNCVQLHKQLQMLPMLGDVYHVTGILKLPYAEIEEPFEAWFNKTGGKSRIQYYDGQVITYQLGYVKPFGANFKVTPETTETEVNIKECFQINGTSENPVRPQSVFPNLTNFQPVRHEHYNGQYCRVLESVSYWGKKKNTYKLWVADGSRGPLPVHYEMKGYNTLLGSHYDKYEIDYISYSHSFSPSIFNLPPGIKCIHWPKVGSEHRILANPMQEFVGRTGEVSQHHEHLFHHYKKKFRKTYKNKKEIEHRRHNFIHNMRYIHSKNRANLSFKLAVNHLADQTPEEMAVMRGRLQTDEPRKGWAFPSDSYSGLTLPESLDWRLYGAVTPVKDQAVCGSCWSFATTGALEGALFLKTGVLTPLSQQVLIDCSWGFGNHACDGGQEPHAFEWIMKHGGIASAEAYGPYMGQNGYCHYNQSELIAPISGYIAITSQNITDLKAALYKHGPIAVNIDASHKSFAFYSSGIYYEPNCGMLNFFHAGRPGVFTLGNFKTCGLQLPEFFSQPGLAEEFWELKSTSLKVAKFEDPCENTTMQLDHAVLAVGYGDLQGEPYWLIKNSWSTYWGNDGYILMSMKENNCGVTSSATYPILA